LNVGGAVDFDEGEILISFAAGLILAGVAHQVWEDGHVVGDFSADGHVDGFAASMVDIGGQTCTASKSKESKKYEKVREGHFVFLVSRSLFYNHHFFLFLPILIEIFD